MLSIAENLARVRSEITSAEQKYAREPGSVSLIAVSKTQSEESINEAIKAGQIDFGESYVQEAARKIEKLNNRRIIWHFIGPIQSNKTRLIASHFAWVHSVDRLRIAQRLNDQRPSELPPLKICIQVNISDEDNKSGVTPKECMTLLEQVVQLPRLVLCGLMAMPRMTDKKEDQCNQFKTLVAIKEQYSSLGGKLNTLSMGTSHDMDSAIAEGSTMVRIGTSIFGPRKINP